MVTNTWRFAMPGLEPPLGLCLLLFVLACVLCEGCKRRCSNLHVEYPFGVENEGCGDPNFQLHGCDTNPYLNYSGLNFSVRYISFEKHFVEVSLEASDTCEGFSKLRSSNFSSGSSFSFASTAGFQQLRIASCHSSLSNTGQRYVNFCSTWFACFGNKFLPGCKDEFSVWVNWKNQVIFNGSRTNFLDLWTNNGFALNWTIQSDRKENCTECYWYKGGLCGYNRTSSEFAFSCIGTTPVSVRGKSNSSRTTPVSVRGKSNSSRTTPVSIRGKSNSSKGRIAGTAVGLTAAAITLAAAAIFFLFVRHSRQRRRSRKVDDTDTAEGNHFAKSETAERSKMSVDPESGGGAADSEAEAVDHMILFSYEELREATESFAEHNEVGDGAFGSVFRGRLRDGRAVAVKRLYHHHHRSCNVNTFLNEARVFHKLQHPHVVRLYGCTSPRSAHLMLVFEYLPNGTLGEHLYGTRRAPGGLPWDLRLRIAAQTAEAIAFLHSLSPPVFHRDVKSSNILLDAHLDVKIADFGLCKPMPGDASHVTTAPQGTPGYVDPEYSECYQLTDKSDVYSYGVVLAEILSGKAAVDVNRDQRFINLANMAVLMIQQGEHQQLMDDDLMKHMEMEMEMEREGLCRIGAMVKAVAELAFRCLAPCRDDRPCMTEVAHILGRLRESSSSWLAQNENEVDCKAKAEAETVSHTSVQQPWLSRSTTPNDSSGAISPV